MVATLEEHEGDNKIRQALEQFERNMSEDPSRNRYQNIAKVHQFQFAPIADQLKAEGTTKKKLKEEQLILPLINGRHSLPTDDDTPDSIKYWRNNKNPTAKGFQRLRLSDLYKEYVKNKQRQQDSIKR